VGTSIFLTRPDHQFSRSSATLQVMVIPDPEEVLLGEVVQFNPSAGRGGGGARGNHPAWLMLTLIFKGS